jgi:putative 4-mercaptohistidine N1-methyltranferase
VDRHAFAHGFFDLIGNVWQWSETPIDGFDGFQVHPAYDDFSTPTFDGKHNLIKGGSWASTGNSAIKHSRYAFRRHFQQHSGLRYVEGDALPTSKMNSYETDDIVAQYIEFHYGEPTSGAESFPVACVKAVTPYLSGRPKARALDIGCATGRASFELAKIYDRVDAVDLSVRLIEPPANLQKTGSQRYVIPDEGELLSYCDVTLSDFDQYEDVAGKISFLQGDACNLADKFTGYDLVFAGNLIDRLYDPAAFLREIQARIRPGGLLVLISPYSWSEEHTARDKWLGGFKANTGESYTTLDGITDILSPAFTLIGTPSDIPFLLRETRRTFVHGLSEMTLWEKV